MNTMNAGGAERVVSILANGFSKKSYDVTVAVTSPLESFYELSLNVKYRKILPSNGSNGFLGKIKKQFIELKNLIKFIRQEKPDVVISFIINIPAILACKAAGVKIIISERNNPKFDPPYLLLRILKKIIYPIADGMVFQTKDVMNFYNKTIKDKSCIIPNPLSDNIPQINLVEEREKVVVSVGRLERQKDQATLLKAFAIVRSKHPDYKLIIYGEGGLRGELELIAKELEIENSVEFPGRTEIIYEKIYRAKAFVFSSIYEGYPNALIEAMALGIPVISTDCEYGPSEIIQDGFNGFIVPVKNEIELAKRIEYIIENESVAEGLGKNAYKIRNKLKADIIISQWIDYIERVV